MKNRTLPNNELFTDYKAAAFAASLIDDGFIDKDKIEIVPVGPEKRAFAKEIKTTSFYYSDKRRHERLRIEINREGIYDMLPEGLFHKPPRGSNEIDEEGMIDDIKLRRVEEQQARLFFSPFDAELNYVKIMTELYESRLDKKDNHTELNKIFELGWDEFSLLNNQQSIIWMNLLPEIQQRRNDLSFISKILSLLFETNFEVSDISHSIKPMQVGDEFQMQLGTGTLGVNTIIGDDFLPDNSLLQINIGPATPSKLITFLPGEKNRAIMDMALSYLIPVDTDVNLDLIIAPEMQKSILSDESESVYLGYTVFV